MTLEQQRKDPRSPKESTSHTTISLEGIQWHYLDKQELVQLSDQSYKGISGVVIKSSPKRTVACSDAGLFVKEIRYKGLRALLKTLIGGNAQKEGRTLLRLGRQNINVPRVVGFGFVKCSGLLQREVLLTKKVADAESLHEFILSIYRFSSLAQKEQLIDEFARFIRSLHDIGIRHKDLHVGNILVQKRDAVQFYLLDADRISLGHGELTHLQRIGNLALLLCSLRPFVGVKERFRFLKSYFQISHSRDGLESLREIEQAALRIARKTWRQKALRCLSTNSRFIKSRYKNFKIFRVRRPEVESALNALLPNPDDLLERGEVLKDGRTVKGAKIEIGGRFYFLKRYNCKGNIYRIRNGLRRSRAVRTWLASMNLNVRNLPVPEPLICIEERRFGLLERSYILYDFVAGERLNAIWPFLDKEDKKRILAKLAILFGKMHESGVYHGDLKWPNILIQKAPKRVQVTLTDLDGTRVYSSMNPTKARKDITRFLLDLEKTGERNQFENSFVKIWEKWSGLSF